MIFRDDRLWMMNDMYRGMGNTPAANDESKGSIESFPLLIKWRSRIQITSRHTLMNRVQRSLYQCHDLFA